MKKAIVIISCVVLFTFCKNSADYKNPKLPIDQRVESLLGQMTLQEKIAQLQCIMVNFEEKDIPKDGIGHLAYVYNDQSPKESVEKYNKLQKYIIEHSRLGIPALYHSVTLCGPQANGHTVFPQPLAQAATWNPDLIEEMANVCVLQTKSRGYRHELSPTINIAYDSRWGRTHETYGEDPLLTSLIAGRFVKVFEQNQVSVALKHFAANIGKNGKFGGAVDLSERFLREIEFPAFKYCIQQCGATAIMPAYNDIDGIPCNTSDWLLKDVLRTEWGFTGFIESDYGDVDGLIFKHFTAKDHKDAAIQAINAGMDVEFPDPLCFNYLAEAVKEGLVSEERINEAVRRVLTQKFRVGIFENPYASVDDAIKYSDNEEFRKLSCKVEEDAIVLLKNENNLLPFSKDIKSIAVLGPLGNEVKLGNYAGWGQKTTSILAGLQNALPNAVINFEPAASFGQVAIPSIDQIYLTTNEGKPGLLGEYFIGKSFDVAPTLTRIDPNIDFNWSDGVPEPHIPAENFCVRWTGKLKSPVTGKFKIGLTIDDGARLYIDDKLVIDDWNNGSERVVEKEFIFTKDKSYNIKVEYFEAGFKAVCKLGWNAVKFDLANAVAMANKSEACVIVVGMPDGEGRDRANLDLNDSQEALIQAIIQTGKPFVVILASGNVISMSKWIEKTPAILHAWYGGEEMGTAVANVLLGNVNPSGKLPISFPRSSGQLPSTYYNRPSGSSEDYLDLPGSPQFYFGFGLSYTTFELKNIVLSDTIMKSKDSLVVKIDIENTGKRDGAEVVQLYIHDHLSSVARSFKMLKNFKKVHLKAGEKQTISLKIDAEMLKFWDKNMKWSLEPGKFDVLIGVSSNDIRLQKTFVVK